MMDKKEFYIGDMIRSNCKTLYHDAIGIIIGKKIKEHNSSAYYEYVIFGICFPDKRYGQIGTPFNRNSQEMILIS